MSGWSFRLKESIAGYQGDFQNGAVNISFGMKGNI